MPPPVLPPPPSFHELPTHTPPRIPQVQKGDVQSFSLHGGSLTGEEIENLKQAFAAAVADAQDSTTAAATSRTNDKGVVKEGQVAGAGDEQAGAESGAGGDVAPRGELSRETFFDLVALLCQQDGTAKVPSKRDLSHAFTQADVDRSGFIDLDEVRARRERGGEGGRAVLARAPPLSPLPPPSPPPPPPHTLPPSSSACTQRSR